MKKDVKKTGTMILSLATLALAASASPAALADDASVNTSSSSAKSLYDKISEKFGLTYFGIYHGAPVNDLGNSLQPDTSGALDAAHPQDLESYVTAGYKLDKNMLLGVSTHFFTFPVGKPAGSGIDATMYDPSLVFARSNLIDNGNGFHMTGKLYATLPLTAVDTLQKQNLAMAITPTAIISWDVPKTKLNLGLYSYIAAYVPTSSAADDHRSYKIVSAPNAAYQLNAKGNVQATMWIDLIQVTRAANTPFIAGMSNDTMDIEPGINWDINPYISINPILNIYPSNPTLAATSLQAVIIGKAF